MIHIRNYYVQRARLFINLLYMDFKVIKQEFVGDLINAITWPASLALNFGYILPAFGMEQSYGSFLLIGAMATTYFYLAIGFASELVSDFEGERCIDYHVILPMPSYKMFVMQRVVSFALHATALAAPLLPIGKLLLGSRLDLTFFAPFKLLLILLMSGMFFGFFALWLAAYLPSTRAISNAWRRVYTPLLMAGCYWYSFQMGQKVFPNAIIITLFNPLTYMTEGVHAAVMGPSLYLHYWICCGALLAAICLMGAAAMHCLRSRLDLL